MTGTTKTDVRVACPVCQQAATVTIKDRIRAHRTVGGVRCPGQGLHVPSQVQAP